MELVVAIPRLHLLMLVVTLPARLMELAVLVVLPVLWATPVLRQQLTVVAEVEEEEDLMPLPLVPMAV